MNKITHTVRDGTISFYSTQSRLQIATNIMTALNKEQLVKTGGYPPIDMRVPDTSTIPRLDRNVIRARLRHYPVVYAPMSCLHEADLSGTTSQRIDELVRKCKAHGLYVLVGLDFLAFTHDMDNSASEIRMRYPTISLYQCSDQGYDLNTILERYFDAGYPIVYVATDELSKCVHSVEDTVNNVLRKDIAVCQFGDPGWLTAFVPNRVNSGQ